jgi:hypothetical protein
MVRRFGHSGFRKERFKMVATKGKGKDASRAEQLIVGTKQDFANTSSLVVAGKTYTPAQVIATLQSLVDLRVSVDTAKAASQAKLAEEKTQAPALRRFMSTYATFVRGSFGDQPDVLAHFGLVPRKPATPLTVEQKAVAAAKRKATRDARHTMGPKQKQDVKGDVTGVTVTPVTATKPVVTSPAPAPATATSTSTPGTASAATPHAS